MEVDFTGSSQQLEAPINVPWPCTKADVFYSVKAMLGPDIPANEGINRAIKVIAPKGCILNPTEPAPLGCQIDTSQRVPDAIFGALAPFFPSRLSLPEMGLVPPLCFREKYEMIPMKSLFSMRLWPEEEGHVGDSMACREFR